MYYYLNKVFSKYQCGFNKDFNAQHSLIKMIEKILNYCVICNQFTINLVYGFDISSLTFLFFILCIGELKGTIMQII